MAEISFLEASKPTDFVLDKNVLLVVTYSVLAHF